MDGKLKVLNLSPSDNKITFDESHFIETSWGVTSNAFFQFPDAEGNLSQEYVVLGYEDGSIHAYDYSRYCKDNYKKLVFNV